MLEKFFNKFHNKSNFTKAINFSIDNDVNFLATRILSWELEFLDTDKYQYAFEACVCELLFLGETKCS